MGIELWFAQLTLLSKIALVLLALPLISLLVGLLIFAMEMPGDSFWGEPNPSFLKQMSGTMGIGAVGALLLGSIFGLNAGLLQIFGYFGAGDWKYTACFLLALFLVIGGLIYFLEIRAHLQ